jgi:hypothetical protein
VFLIKVARFVTKVNNIFNIKTGKLTLKLYLQIENKARMHHILERAQELKDEQLPEVSCSGNGPPDE